MAYDETLAQRIRKAFKRQKRVEEKKMMGGLTFMVNNKMCVGVHENDLMVRLDPEVYDAVLQLPGARPMDFTGKPMRGFVLIDCEGTKQDNDLEQWLQLGLDFNKKAKAARKH